MASKHDMPEVQYDDSQAGKRLRESDRKKGEFARGEKRQGDGV